MAVLPFRESGGQILDRNDAVLVTVAYHVWRGASSSGAGGQIGQWSGVCEPEAAEHLVGKQNRYLLAGGIKFRVEDAIFHDNLNYLELDLVDPRAQG